MLAPRSRPILILDDDPALRTALADHIAQDGAFHVTEAASVAEAEALVTAPAAHFDALILDVALSDGDGCDLCARLRRLGHRMPVLMLTGRDGEQDVVRGLDAGANDYVAKPFRPAELLARVRAQLRSFDASGSAAMRIGPYVLRPADKLLQDMNSKRRIPLTAGETRLLCHLQRAGGEAVEREALLRDVWGYRANAGVTTHTLETHIYRLRQKIEPTPASPRLLVTAGRGYRLALGPERLPDRAAA